MGRGKVDIKRIENKTTRQVTFCKRRGGLVKKANELSVLCDVQIGLIVFSASGKLTQYCSPSLRMEQIIERYLSKENLTPQQLLDRGLMVKEMTRLREDNEHLELSLRRYRGDDLSSTRSMADLDELEIKLQRSLDKVRLHKEHLLRGEMERLKRKVEEEEQHAAALTLMEQQHHDHDYVMMHHHHQHQHMFPFLEMDQLQANSCMLQLAATTYDQHYGHQQPTHSNLLHNYMLNWYFH